MGCSLIGSAIVGQTQNGLNKLMDFAEESVDEVTRISNTLVDLVQQLAPTDIDINFDNFGQLSDPYTITEINLAPPTFNGPAVGSNDAVDPVVYNSTAVHPGDFTELAPDLDWTGAPEPDYPEDPGNAPAIGDYEFPADPTEEIPGLPTLYPISIPSFDPLVFPDFTGVEPVDPGDDGIGVFDWTEDAYVGTVQDEVVAQIQDILGGSTGIPTMIWDMIEARARKQIRATARQQQEEAKDYWASMGHFLSTGQERKRVKEAGDQEAEGVSQIIRDLLEQDARIYVERLNTALAQGIALEGQLIGLHNSSMQRSLDAAKTVFDIALRVAQFKIDRYNIRMQAFLTHAQVYQTRIQAEIAKLEEVKAYIEIERLKSTVNLQIIETYKAQIQAILANYDVFKTLVQTVSEKYNADQIRVAAFAETVKVFSEKYKGIEIQWRGYAEKVKAQLGKIESYKIESDIYATKIDAYGKNVEADKTDVEAQAATARSQVEVIQATLENLRLQLEEEKARVDTELKKDENKLRLHDTDGRIEQYRVTSDEQRVRLINSQASTQLEILLKEAQLVMADMNNILNAQTNAYNNTLQAQSGIGSSAFTALNYAATISDQVANTHACNNNYSF